jgi:hypothetical protein
VLQFKKESGIILRIFKTKVFSRFAKKEGICDVALLEAVKRAETGLIDADLGSNVIKQRIKREGQGRSSGYRVLIAVRLKKLSATAKQIESSLIEGELKEIKHEKKF